MTSKEMAYQYRLARWTGLAKERAELGMSIRSYCAMKGFAENTYFYWQRRLRDVASVQLETVPTNLPATQFTQVELAATAVGPPEQRQNSQLHVQINGIHLSADSSYPPEKLAALLRELQTSC